MSALLWVLGGVMLAAGFVSAGISGIAHKRGDQEVSNWFGRIGVALIVVGALLWRHA